jgi:hypothetical protein
MRRGCCDKFIGVLTDDSSRDQFIRRTEECVVDAIRWHAGLRQFADERAQERSGPAQVVIRSRDKPSAS